MKIRTDFVTNSSSTNFLIISKDEVGTEQLAAMFGVKKESPFAKHIEYLIDAIISGIRPVGEYVKNYDRNMSCDVEIFIKKKFSKQTCERFQQCKETNEHVYIGSFRSEGPEFVAFFCMESLIIENDNIYFDAIECGW